MPYETENKQLNSEGHFIYGDFSRNKKKKAKVIMYFPREKKNLNIMNKILIAIILLKL